MGVIIGIIIYLIVAAIVLLIVDRLNLGLSVAGFGNAIIAAAVIAIVTWVISWLLGLLGISIPGGVLGAIIAVIVSAVVLMISDRFLTGMKVQGFTGAIVAAIAIGVLGWLVSLVLGPVLAPLGFTA
jgi:putative membrane protein